MAWWNQRSKRRQIQCRNFWKWCPPNSWRNVEVVVPPLFDQTIRILPLGAWMEQTWKRLCQYSPKLWIWPKLWRASGSVLPGHHCPLRVPPLAAPQTSQVVQARVRWIIGHVDKSILPPMQQIWPPKWDPILFQNLQRRQDPWEMLSYSLKLSQSQHHRTHRMAGQH